jgi:hypothetical protein
MLAREMEATDRPRLVTRLVTTAHTFLGVHGAAVPAEGRG